MPRTSKFRKVASGGVDRGDGSLNQFGMVPVVQKSAGVSAVATTNRIAVVPQDGGEILEILTLVHDDVVGSAAAASIEFGTSANTSAFGTIIVSGEGRYTLPLRNITGGDPTGTVHVSAWTVTAATIITATLATAGGGDITRLPSFVCYTTFLQNLADT